MACLRIQNVLRAYGIGVDDFSPTVTQVFLSHVHQDHIQSISTWVKKMQQSNTNSKSNDKQRRCIWMHPLSAKLLKTIIDVPDYAICVLRSHKWYRVQTEHMGKNHWYVSCWSSFHCPGSVMFAFADCASHQVWICTGDFRWVPQLRNDMNWLIRSCKQMIKTFDWRAHWFYDATFAYSNHVFPSLEQTWIQFSDALTKVIRCKDHAVGCDVVIHVPRVGIETWIARWLEEHPENEVVVKSLWMPDHVRSKQLQLLLSKRIDHDDKKQKGASSSSSRTSSTIWLGHARDGVKKDLEFKRGRGRVLIYPSCTYQMCPPSNKWTDKYDEVYYIPFCTHSSAPELQEFMCSWLEECQMHAPKWSTDFQACRETEHELSCY